MNNRFNNIIKLFIKYFILFAVGGMSYIITEILYRGYSAVEMAFCGGICFVLIGLINNGLPWEMPIWVQSLIGGILIVTPVELIFGLLFNKDYHIWDYRNLPLNFFDGQVCILFTIIWCLLAIVCIVADDYLRYFIFNEEKPKYRWL